jgi:pimeloyl-ACP methyl ester carboxylesterase
MRGFVREEFQAHEHGDARCRQGGSEAREHLRDRGGPVWILHGEKEMTFPIGTAQRLHAALPGSTLAEVPGAVHTAHFDNPTDRLTAVCRFLAPQ